MTKEITGIPATFNEFGEKEYTLHSTNNHRAMVYQKVDGSGRVTVEENTGAGWVAVDEQKKTAQEMGVFLIRECVQCGAELVNNHCNCEQRGQ